MAYQARDFSHLTKIVKGLSEDQIRAHVTLYNGYVNALNEIVDDENSVKDPQGNYSFSMFSEKKRRFPVAYNGMILHELYFDNLGPSAGEKGEFRKALDAEWGSLATWKKEVTESGKGAGNGWVLTAFEIGTGKLRNVVLTEHHVGWPAGHMPIMVLDMWEHAYAIDYGISKKDYAEVFFDNLNWEILDKRFQDARQRDSHSVNASSRELRYVHAAGGGIG